MKLVVDLGNTYKKYYLFDNKVLIKEYRQELPDSEWIKKLAERHGPFSSAIISSVIQDIEDICSTIKKYCNLIVVDHNTPLPITIKYETPETLGIDRIAAAVAGHTMFPENNVLIIDAGTCITYELVTKQGEYIGGAIAPGLKMQLKALHNFTGKLPLVNLKENPALTGTTTEESILSGTINHTRAAMQKTIDLYHLNFQDLKIIISGGDRIFFDKQLKNSIFAISNVVATGLNEILEFNEKQ